MWNFLFVSGCLFLQRVKKIWEQLVQTLEIRQYLYLFGFTPCYLQETYMQYNTFPNKHISMSYLCKERRNKKIAH